jgi:hypothetical protein
MSESLETVLSADELLFNLERQAQILGSEGLLTTSRNRQLRSLVAGSELGAMRRRMEHLQTYSAARGRLNCPAAKLPALSNLAQLFYPARNIRLYSSSPLHGAAELLQLEAGVACLVTATEHPSIICLKILENPEKIGYTFARQLKQRCGFAGWIELELETPLFIQIPNKTDLSDERMTTPILIKVLTQILALSPQAPEDWMRDRGDGSVVFRFFRSRLAGPDAFYLRLPKRISWQKFRRQDARFPAWPLLLESAVQTALGDAFMLEPAAFTEQQVHFLLTGQDLP